jgi:hypothetical protein
MEGPPLTLVASKTKDWNPSFWSFLCPIFGIILLFVSPALIVIAAPVVRRLFYPFDHRTIGQAFARLSGASEIPVKQNPKKYKP